MERVINGQVVTLSAAEQAAVEAEWAADSSASRRATASMTRTDFCKALWRAGLLPQSEAVLAARGEWPATFATFTAGLSADDAADAQIDWAAATSIRYSHPTLQALALAHAGGDQAAATTILDSLFGIS